MLARTTIRATSATRLRIIHRRSKLPYPMIPAQTIAYPPASVAVPLVGGASRRLPLSASPEPSPHQHPSLFHH